MGSSFVGLNGKGFWMRDGILELWLRLLSLHIEDSSDHNSPNTSIRNQWLLASRGFFSGCVPTEMESAVSTEEGKAVVIKAINSLLEGLKDAPDLLSKDFLNLLGFQSPWTMDIETARMAEVCQAFLDLIDGKITMEARDMSFKPGCRTDH